jgi:hypothetical protein
MSNQEEQPEPEQPRPQPASATAPSQQASLTADDATKLLKLELRNLRRKVLNGQTLNQAERAILTSIAQGAEQSGAPDLRDGHVRNKVDLAAALGVNRKTIDRWFEEESHPIAHPDGRHSISEWREWCQQHGKRIGDGTPSQAQLKARQLVLQNRLLEDKIAVNKRELVLVSETEIIGASLATAIRKEITSLHLLAPALVGCTVNEIQEILKEKEVDIIEQLHVLASSLEEMKVQDIPATEDVDDVE